MSLPEPSRPPAFARCVVGKVSETLMNWCRLCCFFSIIAIGLRLISQINLHCVLDICSNKMVYDLAILLESFRLCKVMILLHTSPARYEDELALGISIQQWTKPLIHSPFFHYQSDPPTNASRLCLFASNVSLKLSYTPSATKSRTTAITPCAMEAGIEFDQCLGGTSIQE